MSASLSGKQGGSTLVVAPRVPIGPDLSNDPLAGQQWYVRNTGQTGYADTGGVAGMDLPSRTPTARDWLGAGVKVGVVDTGLEIAHEDLAANVVHGSWNFLTASSDPSPAPSVTDGDHGTSVSGIIAMVYGNAKGGMGVAPGRVAQRLQRPRPRDQPERLELRPEPRRLGGEPGLGRRLGVQPELGLGRHHARGRGPHPRGPVPGRRDQPARRKGCALREVGRERLPRLRADRLSSGLPAREGPRRLLPERQHGWA